MIIDDNLPVEKSELKVEENKRGTIRVNGKTERELLKEYREEFGEEKYKRFKEKLAQKRK